MILWGRCAPLIANCMLIAEDKMQKKASISLEKKYRFSNDMKCIRCAGKYIYIVPKTASYIVLENDVQNDIFNCLCKETVGSVCKIFKENMADFISVLQQIEAKRLYKRFAKKKKSFLSEAFIYLTKECNLRCAHCFMFAGNKFENELSTEEVFALLDNLKKVGCEAVTFSGGEAMMKRDFLNILKKAKELNFKVELFSNGTLWTKELIDLYSPFIHKIQISVDGFDEQSHAAVRGKGHFLKAIWTIDAFLQKDVPVSMAVTPLLENLKEHKEKYISFIFSLKNKYKDKPFGILISQQLFPGRDVSLSKNESEEYKKITKQILDVISPDLDKNNFALNFNNEKQISCNFGELNVMANGDVYFCGEISSLKPVRNLRNTSFLEIVEQAHIANRLISVENIKPCKYCELRYICGANCRLEFLSKIKNCTDFSTLDNEDLEKRPCTTEFKENILKLMIDANDLLFS